MACLGANAMLAAVTADQGADGVPNLLIDDTGMLTGVPDGLVDDFSDI